MFFVPTRFCISNSVTFLITGTKCQAEGYIREEGFILELELIVRLWGTHSSRIVKQLEGSVLQSENRVGRKLGQATK